MTIGVYKTREEAESAVKSLEEDGLPAAILSTRESSLNGIVRTWQVVIPRECSEYVGEAD
jgi:hypothetical protein